MNERDSVVVGIGGKIQKFRFYAKSKLRRNPNFLRES